MQHIAGLQRKRAGSIRRFRVGSRQAAQRQQHGQQQSDKSLCVFHTSIFSFVWADYILLSMLYGFFLCFPYLLLFISRKALFIIEVLFLRHFQNPPTLDL